MKRSSKKTKNNPKKKHVSATFLVPAVVILVCFGLVLSILYTNSKNIERIDEKVDRDLLNTFLFEAVDSLTTPIITNSQTGDLYIPQAKLYVENDSSFNQSIYEYRYDENPIDDYPLLIVTSNTAKNYYKNQIRMANSSEDALDFVPNLQACQRGVQLFTEDDNHENYPERIFAYTLKVEDGRSFNVYYEDKCETEIQDTLELVKKLKSY